MTTIHDTTSAALTRYLAQGEELDAATLAHLRECGECSETLRRAQLLSELLDDAGTVPVAVEPVHRPLTAEVVAMARRRRLFRVGLAVMTIVVALVSWRMTTGTYRVRHPLAIWTMLMILFDGPLVLAMIISGADTGGSARVYKRMRGRQLSGICQGFAEAFGIPVWILRMAFVGLFFLKGSGLLIYLLLDALLPIHPDDRSMLLRFRVERWWRARNA